MKRFLISYTFREQSRTARVAADSEREAEARFRSNHPRVGDIRVESLRRPPPPPIPPPRAPVVHLVRLDPVQQERVLAEARRLIVELRAKLSAKSHPQP